MKEIINIKNIYTQSASKGNQEKYHIDDEWIKLDELGYESAAETLSYLFLKYSNLAQFSIPYNIETAIVKYYENIDDIPYNSKNICSVSKHFLKESDELITLEDIFKKYIGLPMTVKLKEYDSLKEKIEYTINLVKTATKIPNFESFFTALIEFDALVLNEDRHGNNVCFIKHQDGTYTPIVFDNGASFLSDIRMDYQLSRNTFDCIKTVCCKTFSPYKFTDVINTLHELYGSHLRINEIPQNEYNKIIQLVKHLYEDQRIYKRIEDICDYQIDQYRSHFLDIRTLDTSKSDYIDD